jgi:TDG/mug DNA glycosylase family protein
MAADHRVSSFPPQVGPDCRLLLLGSVPSVRSLELRQSYGHPHNLFWRFMGEMFDAGPDLPYAERIGRLHTLGIGIWDVLRDCERPGSLDASIVRASEVPNDIAGLLRVQPRLRTIALNGGKAQEAFRRLVRPTLPAELARTLTVLALPSTSPANASMPVALKRERWRVLLDHVDPAGRTAAE